MDPLRPAYASATCETHRNVGPRSIHGCVTLEFERASEFTFTSQVTWPESDNYDLAIEGAVHDALLLMQSSHTLSCRLVGIRWHTVDSCQSGFVFAANQATRAALEQIKWDVIPEALDLTRQSAPTLRAGQFGVMRRGNAMPEISDQEKVMALAIYEIRLLLNSYLGSENEGDMAVRQAAHLAYALHNQALAVLDGKTFDVPESIDALKFSATMLGAGFTDKFKKLVRGNA